VTGPSAPLIPGVVDEAAAPTGERRWAPSWAQLGGSTEKNWRFHQVPALQTSKHQTLGTYKIGKMVDVNQHGS